MVEKMNRYLLGREGLLGQDREEKISFLDVFLIVCVLILTANIFIQSYWLSPVKIDGTSMRDTLQNGDWLYMDKLTDYERGDVVVFAVSSKVNYIKRIIAMPGDTIYSKNGKIYLKEKGKEEFFELYEPYAYFSDGRMQGTYIISTTGDIKKTTLKEGEIFVLGDNRWGSRDSREIGPVKCSSILGVVPKWSIESKERYAWYLEFIEKVNGLITKKSKT